MTAQAIPDQREGWGAEARAVDSVGDPDAWSGSRVAVGVLVAGMAVTAAAVWHLGRGTTFFYDEWDFVMQRRSGGLDSLLRAHNGHLNLVSAAAFRALFSVVGLRHYGLFRAMVVACHLACCGLLFVYARKRVGDVAALGAAAMLLAAGRAWEDLLWPFQSALILSVVAGLATLRFLDRGTRGRDTMASAALALSLASFSVGIPVVVGVSVELALRRDWRRLWVPGAPAVAYGLWYARYGGTGEPLARRGDVLPFMRRGAEAAVAALFGATPARGGILLVLLVVLAVAVLTTRRGLDHPRVACAIATVTVFWLLTGLTRASSLPEAAGASRYLYVGAAFLLVLIVELGKDLRLNRGAGVLVLAIAALVARSNATVLRAGAAGLRDVSTIVKAELAAVEIAGPGGDATAQPDSQRMPQVRAGAYLAAVRQLGSPSDSSKALLRAPDAARRAADAALGTLLRLRVEPAASAPVECRPLARPVRDADVAIAGGRLVILAGTQGTDVRLRRFGSSPSVELGRLQAGRIGTLQIPPDLSPVAWHLILNEGAQVVRCPGGSSR